MSSTATGNAPFDHKLEEKHLLARAEELVERSRAVGADEAEAYGVYSKVASVQFEKGGLKLAQVDSGTSLGLRVFRDKKQGFSCSNQTSDGTLAQTARDAVELAGFSLPDEHNALPEPRSIEPGPSLVQKGLCRQGVEEVVARGQELVERIAAVDKRIAIDKASFQLSFNSVAIHTSKGISLAESDAMASSSAFGMAVDGDDVGGFDYWGDSLRQWDDVDASIDEVVRRFTTGVLGNLNAGASESYQGPVLFSPSAFMGLFISPVIGASSAIAVQRGRSALKGKLGESIAAPLLSIVDDPTDVTLSGSASFDREGQPATKMSLVSDGVLQNYLYNSYAALVDGRLSTGHAAGGARSVPALGAHGILVAPGTGGDEAAMMKSFGRGLYCGRFSGTVDPASGDFSGVAKSARWIENGEVVRSVRETLISGNAFELLNQIVSLSSVAESLMGSTRVPSAIVDGISVTAG